MEFRGEIFQIVVNKPALTVEIYLVNGAEYVWCFGDEEDLINFVVFVADYTKNVCEIVNPEINLSLIERELLEH